MDAWQHVEPRGTNSPRTCHYFFFFRRPSSSLHRARLLLHFKHAVYSYRQCSYAFCRRRHDSVTCDTRVKRTTSKPSILVTIARGTHLFPFRTESLSPVAPMVLHLNWCGRVGSRQVFLSKSSCMLRMQELFAFIQSTFAKRCQPSSSLHTPSSSS